MTFIISTRHVHGNAVCKSYYHGCFYYNWQIFHIMVKHKLFPVVVFLGFVGTQYYIILPLLVNSDSLNNNTSDYEWHRIIPHPILQVASDNYKFSIFQDN